MKKSYMTDYLRIICNVIYDETVGLQARSCTTPAKYDSARTNSIRGRSAENLGFWPSLRKRK